MEGRVVPFPRWLATVVAVSAPVLLVSGCSLPGGAPIPGGVPPPPGDPIPAIAVVAPGRPADQLRGWAEQRAPALDIPVTALEAYAYAARVVEIENPGCHLAWTTLAGIGKVESQHGTYRGADVAPNGDVTPPIRGVRLDGTNGNLAIVDAEASTAGDPVYARAMGPMQFIPETWERYGVDANNDGIASPDNIDDAALSAAGYLCSRGPDLGTARGWMNALRAYNRSESYARLVRDWAAAYSRGQSL
jgi:membrane-bound lytic murein transglycosylase B